MDPKLISQNTDPHLRARARDSLLRDDSHRDAPPRDGPRDDHRDGPRDGHHGAPCVPTYDAPLPHAPRDSLHDRDRDSLPGVHRDRDVSHDARDLFPRAHPLSTNHRSARTLRWALLPIYGGVRTVRCPRIPTHHDVRTLCGDRTHGDACLHLTNEKGKVQFKFSQTI